MAQFLNWMLRTCTVLKPIDQIVKWCYSFIELASTRGQQRSSRTCVRGAPVNCILVLVVAWKQSTNFGNEVLWCCIGHLCFSRRSCCCPLLAWRSRANKCLKESNQQVPEEGRSLCHGYCEAMSKAQPSEGAEAERVDIEVRVHLGREIVLLLITL